MQGLAWLNNTSFMNAIVLFLLAMLAAPVLLAQNKLVVTVEGIRGGEGSVMVGLFGSKQTFLKKATYGKVVSVRGNVIKVTFEDITPGDYGISIIHDANNNGELDTNALGIPREGFAFGNNAMGIFGPPSFDKAKVTVTTDELHQVIRVKYF